MRAMLDEAGVQDNSNISTTCTATTATSPTSQTSQIPQSTVKITTIKTTTTTKTTSVTTTPNSNNNNDNENNVNSDNNNRGNNNNNGLGASNSLHSATIGYKVLILLSGLCSLCYIVLYSWCIGDVMFWCKLFLLRCKMLIELWCYICNCWPQYFLGKIC